MNTTPRQADPRRPAVTDAAVHGRPRGSIGCWTRAAPPAMMCSPTALSLGQDRAKARASGYNSGLVDGVAQSSAVFSAASATPSRIRARVGMCSGAAERARRSDRAHDRHRPGARQDRLPEPHLDVRRLVTLERLAAA